MLTAYFAAIQLFCIDYYPALKKPKLEQKVAYIGRNQQYLFNIVKKLTTK